FSFMEKTAFAYPQNCRPDRSGGICGFLNRQLIFMEPSVFLCMPNPTDYSPSPYDALLLWAMAAVAFFVFYSNFMIAPLVPAFSREFGVTPYQLGWLVPSFSIAYAVSTLIYGVFSDRFGRAPVLLVLLLFASLTSLLVSFAHTARELILLRMLSGAGCGGIVTITLASIGDRYPYAVQGRPMGKIFGAVAAGMGLGSSFGPLLNPLIGWRTQVRALACGYALAAVLVTQCKRSFLHANGRLDSYRKIGLEYVSVVDSSRGGAAIAFIFCNGVFHGGVFAWLGLLVATRYHLGDAGIGLMLAGYGLPDLVFGGVIGGWADRYGRRYVVPSGFLWAGSCALLLALPISRLSAALVITALSVGFEATHPLMSSIATSLDPRHRGQITGLATFTKFLGMAAGALIFQHLMGLSFRTALIVFGTMEVVAGIAAIHGFRKEGSRKDQDRAYAASP
ncbi:MAG: MFS transporter, partial [Acidobacteriaceae bacterium]